MTSKKGTTVASTPIPVPVPAGSASTRGSMTSKGSASAKQFLNARWQAVEAAASKASLGAGEKPDVHRERSANTGVSQQTKQGGSGPAKTGSPWGRRH